MLKNHCSFYIFLYIYKRILHLYFIIHPAFSHLPLKRKDLTRTKKQPHRPSDTSPLQEEDLIWIYNTMIDQHNSLAEKFLKKGFWLYLFSFIIAPIWYIIKIIISGELTVSEVGILYWIISLVTMISAYNDLWMSESLKHYIPQFVAEKRYDKVKTLLFFAFIIQIITSLIVVIIFYFWSTFIAENYFKTLAAKETLQVFAFFFLGLNLFQTLSQFFLSIQDTLAHKWTEFLRMWFIMLSVLFIFLWNGWSLLEYSYSWLVWLYVWIVFALIIFIKKYYGKYLKNTQLLSEKWFITPIIKYAWLVVVGTSAATLLWQIDMQMIIYLLGTTEAGYYTNYLSIITIPFMLIGPVFAFIFPVISEMHGKWDISKIQLLKNIFTKNFIAIGIMFNIFFFVFAQILAYTLFWEKFIESGNILQYSILLLIFNFLLQINFNILAGIWKVKERVKIIFIAVVFNFIMNIILINILWVYWAALATGFGWLLIFILTELFLWKTYRIQLQYKNICKNILLMWFSGLGFYHYILPYFENISRLQSLLFLALSFGFWSIIFIVANIWTFKGFIWELKKMKQKS